MNIEAYKALPDNIKPLADELFFLRGEVADIRRLLMQAVEIDARDGILDLAPEYITIPCNTKQENAGC